MYRLTEAIIRDIKKLFETTTGGDIAYLPSQVGSIAPILQGLSRLKKTWKLNFIENLDDSKIVNFEDMLKVKVQNSDFTHFVENVLHLKALPMDSTVTLTQYLKEAFDEDINQSYIELKEKLLNMISVEPFLTADLNFEDWKTKFGVKGYSSPRDILIRFETFKRDIEILMEKLREGIVDDKGELDILINTIKSRGSLNKFPIFKDTKYLLGSIVNSEYKGISLIYSVTVSPGYVIQESVTIVNADDLISEVGAYRGMKVQGNQIFPVGGVFSQRFFNFLRDNIIDRI